MAEEKKELRRLVIKAYHVREAKWGEENKLEENGVLTVDKDSADRYKRGKERIYFKYIFSDYPSGGEGSIYEYDHGYYTISTKVLGNIGMESHTL